jgi:hypothetical protein
MTEHEIDWSHYCEGNRGWPGETATVGRREREQFRGIKCLEIVGVSKASTTLVVPTDRLPQLDAHWLVLQPSVFRQDPTRGWEPVDETFGLFIGSEELSQIESEVQSATLCHIQSLGEAGVTIENFSDEPIDLVVGQAR